MQAAQEQEKFAGSAGLLKLCSPCRPDKYVQVMQAII